jgi:hypothetical protein
MKTETKIGCLACGKELDNLEYTTRSNGTKVEVHPMGGLHFRTEGHYGSTIFDPMGTGEYLDVAICDDCVAKNIDKVRGNGLKQLRQAINYATTLKSAITDVKKFKDQRKVDNQTKE